MAGWFTLISWWTDRTCPIVQSFILRQKGGHVGECMHLLASPKIWNPNFWGSGGKWSRMGISCDKIDTRAYPTLFCTLQVSVLKVQTTCVCKLPILSPTSRCIYSLSKSRIIFPVLFSSHTNGNAICTGAVTVAHHGNYLYVTATLSRKIWSKFLDSTEIHTLGPGYNFSDLFLVYCSNR